MVVAENPRRHVRHVNGGMEVVQPLRGGRETREFHVDRSGNMRGCLASRISGATCGRAGVRYRIGCRTRNTARYHLASLITILITLSGLDTQAIGSVLAITEAIIFSDRHIRIKVVQQGRPV